MLADRPSRVVSDDNRFRSTIGPIRSLLYALEAYYLNHGSYPLQSVLVTLKSVNEEELTLNDQWGNALYYSTSLDAQRYVIASPGKNNVFERDPSSYMYDIPRTEFYDQQLRTTGDIPSDDFILANGCDRNFPIDYQSGFMSFCREEAVTSITLQNIKDALKSYFEVKAEYPKKIEPVSLSRNIRGATGLPYIVSDQDGWGRKLFYATYKDRKGYVLASSGGNGKYTRSPSTFLISWDGKVEESDKTDDLVIVNGLRAIWPRFLPF